MTIVRRKVTRNFSAISNEAANDPRLGGEQLGLLHYLLTRPNDWNVRIPALQRRLHWGRDKTYRVLNALADLGYTERKQGRERRTGTFERVEYIVYDEPVANRLPETKETAPSPDFPLPDLSKAAKRERIDSHKILPPSPTRTAGITVGGARQ